MIKCSPRPLRLGLNGTIVDADGQICMHFGDDCWNTATALRMVVCYNACAGIDNPEKLVPKAVAAMRALARDTGIPV